MAGCLVLAGLPGGHAAPRALHSTLSASVTPGWLARLNAWRESTGVPDLTENTTWDAGDYAHSQYMVKDNLVTHYEDPSQPYYTVAGDTAARNGNIEVNSSTAFTDQQSIDWWMAAPFHAMGMMDPRLTQTGFGSYREVKSGWDAGFTLDVLRGNPWTGGTYPVYFPGNNAIVPLTTYGGNEFPNPLQACPGYSAPTGLPAFIQVGGNVATSVSAHSFTGNGVALAHCVIDSTNSTFTNYLQPRGGVIVIPQAPLVPGVRYTVSLTVNGVAYSWSFGVTASGSFSPGPPTILNVQAGNATATVSWSAPANSGGSAITSYVVTAYAGSTAQATQTLAATATSATFSGLTNGTTYTFGVAAANALGTGPEARSYAVTPSASGVTYTGYFSWFDNVTRGMVSDNFHVLNGGGSVAHVAVNMPGASPLVFSLAPGTEQHVTFPPGHIGGPVVVTSDQQIQASERVQYFSSFNEVWAMTTAQAATTGYINWFDKASPGMDGDNIHVVNPGVTTAHVTVSLAGQATLSFALMGGQENYVSFPAGAIGGPVVVSSDQPVLAAQRVQYYQSFNEVVARNAGQAQKTSYFNWFDRATPGMVSDNIHLLNPGATAAGVTVSMPGAAAITVPLAAGAERYVSFPAPAIGGPVTVSSDQPILASQRVQYYESFNEVPSADASQAATTSHLMWFDTASAGMVGDNLHILNPGGTAATVTVTLAGFSSVAVPVPAGVEVHVTFPLGSIGGPVTISSSVPVLAAQRVQYYQSFNEVAAA